MRKSPIEAIWLALKQARPKHLSVNELPAIAGLPIEVCYFTIDIMCKRGLITCDKEGDEIILCPQASLIKSTEQKVSRREKLWHHIRIKRFFSIDDLCTSPDYKPDTVRKYVNELVLNGHLTVYQNKGSVNFYRLVSRHLSRPLPGEKHEG